MTGHIQRSRGAGRMSLPLLGPCSGKRIINVR
jgi:hypothetical protein